MLANSPRNSAQIGQGETFMTNGNGTPPEAASGCPSSTFWRSISRTFRSRIRTRRPRSQQQAPAAPDQHPDQCQRQQSRRNRVRGDAVGRGQGRDRRQDRCSRSSSPMPACSASPNVPQENLHPLVMIECPRLLFPFAREIIATAVRDGGFPPLMLDPVDFVGLYRQNMERQDGALSRAERSGLSADATRCRREAGCRTSSAMQAGQELVPDRLVAERCDEGPMRPRARHR